METNGTNHPGLWKGFMVGSLLGAAAGFILAPKSGKELMSEVKDKTDKALDETKRFYSESRIKFKDALTCVAGRKEKASLRHRESPEEMAADA
jgi:gas vesicle protein